MNTVRVQAIYCDDIRREEGNKLILIGVYHSDLLALSFPLTLPQFSIFVQLRLPPEQATATWHVELLKDSDTSLLTADFSFAPAGAAPAEDGLVTATVLLEGTNFAIDSPGRLYVKLTRGEDVIETHPLWIRQGEDRRAEPRAS